MAIVKENSTEKSYFIKEGNDLLSASLIDLALPFKFGCCKGTCGVCCFKVVEGMEKLSPLTKQEKTTLKAKNKNSFHHRLACQCALLEKEVLIEV